MKRLLTALTFACAVVPMGISCNGSFPQTGAGKRIILTLKSGDPGSPTNRAPIQFHTGPTFTFDVQMMLQDGNPDDAFDGWVRLSAEPGSILPVQRNVHLVGGVARGVPVTVIAAFGDARIWAEDVGYVPTPAGRAAPPACANGIDDNGNGTIDFPADPGCFAPDDDDEGAGTLATGTGSLLYFSKPRVGDVRGVGENAGMATPFPHEQVTVDTGYHAETNSYDFSVVVTRIAADGFYITDVEDQNNRGYASVFAYTFSPPTRLAVCDRLRAFAGTASDFFGFTEIGFPTWAVEFYDPVKPARPCLVPEPRVLGIPDLSNLPVLFKYESALVRLQTGGTITVHLGRHFGPGNVPLNAMMAYAPDDDHSNCDLNGSGKVDFGLPDESACSKACSADPECSEFSNFKGQSQFTLVVTDTATMAVGTIEGNASSSPDFNPVNARGQMLGAFTGTLRYFSGGSQFTIEARCGDDVIADMTKQPISSDKACVPKTRPEIDNNEMSH
jgi:hypothetical protein